MDAVVRFSRRNALVAVLASVLLIAWSGAASAVPTAEFAFGPTTPEVAQPVTFTFDGTCDVPPCRIQWRWFKAGGSSLGTFMGEGPALSYAFPAVGAYFVVAKMTNATRTHAFATATHVVSVRATYQDDRRQVRYGTWRGVTAPDATGGGYRVSGATGAAVALAFSGPEVSYVARTGPNLGVASVTVDGVARGTLDLYSAAAGTRTVSVAGLNAAKHRIVIRQSGAANADSTGTGVSLDEFVVGETHVDDRDVAVAYGAWSGVASSGASGGTVHISAAGGASTTLAFTGSSVTWLTATGPDQGRASVAIDGLPVAVVDNYSAIPDSLVPRTFAGLSFGPHSIRVTVLGSHDDSATASLITSDAFVVQ